MNDMRKRIGEYFYWLGARVYDHPKKVLLVVFVLMGLLFTWLPKITVDISTEGFFHETDASLIDYNKFRDQFGRDELIIVMAYTKDVFDLDILDRVKKLHKDLEANVPYLDEVTSLVNIRNTRGEGDELIVEDFLEAWPQNEADLEKLRELALGNRMYENFIISKDAAITTFVIETQTYS
ncbi:MAG: Fis family transcriptional regulator, partial [Desulfobacterales bacterium]|nr:Fis family transcriptional regulator [Desulfobacterales bacterium]